MAAMNKCIAAVLLVCSSCSTGEVKTGGKADTIQVTPIVAINPDPVDIDTSAYATMYVVIADTGQDYFPLQQAMYRLSRSAQIPVDTMNRYYNQEKNEIILKEDDEDEIYRGSYFPRRYQTSSLSLEYYYT